MTNNKNFILSRINKFFIFLIIGLSIYFGYKIFYTHKPMVNPSIETDEEMQTDSTVSRLTSGVSKSYRDYAQQLQTKDMFLLPAKKQIPPPKPPPRKKIQKNVIKTPKNVLKLNQTLKLVGIVLDNNPEAIVEDIASKQTLFLRVGDRYKEAVVEDIREGQVIFNYNGQQVVLKN